MKLNKSIALMLLVFFISLTLVFGGCSQKKNNDEATQNEQLQKQQQEQPQAVEEKTTAPKSEENNYGVLKPVMDLGQEILKELKKPKKVVLAKESVKEIVDGVKGVQQPAIQPVAQQPPAVTYQYQQPATDYQGAIDEQRKRYVDEEEPGYSGALRERAQRGWSRGEILPKPLNKYRNYALKPIIKEFRIDFYSDIKNSRNVDGLVIIPCVSRNIFLGDRKEYIRLDFEIASNTENGSYEPFYVISDQNMAEYIDEANRIDSDCLSPDWLEFKADLQKKETAYCNMYIGKTIENYDRKLNLFVFLAGNGILYYRIYPIAFAYNKNPEYIN